MEINGVNVYNSNQKDVAEMIRVSGSSHRLPYRSEDHTHFIVQCTVVQSDMLVGV